MSFMVEELISFICTQKWTDTPQRVWEEEEIEQRAWAKRACRENEMKSAIIMKTKVKIGLITWIVAEIRTGLLTVMTEEDKTRERLPDSQTLNKESFCDGWITREMLPKIHLSSWDHFSEWHRMTWGRGLYILIFLSPSILMKSFIIA